MARKIEVRERRAVLRADNVGLRERPPHQWRYLSGKIQSRLDWTDQELHHGRP